MNTATCTREMIGPRHNSIRAFTIMELLVVISIIAVVAGLVVGLAGMAGKTGKIKLTESTNERLVTLINSYQAKLGVYPRDNKNNPGMNSLLYELAGAIRDTNTADPTYYTPFAPPIQASVLNANFGVNGIQNSVDIGGETSQVHRLLKDIRPDQVAAVAPGTLSLVVPVDGPSLNRRPNPWRYLVGDNATNNPTTFDLWADIVVGNKTNTIGNWKD